MVIKLKINGINIEAKEGLTIYQAAREYGIRVPAFCYHPRLCVEGACRICVVEIEGIKNLVASCSTPIKEGMIIHTHSKRVIEARRVILELLLANHDLNCITCRKNLNCKLQSYASDLMIEKISYQGEMRDYKKTYPVDDSSVSIIRDPSKCILCGRCVRVCNEMQTVYAIDNINRGFYLGISSPFKHKLSESSCVNCGQCVVNCPTAALLENTEISEVVELLRAKEAGKSNKVLIVQTAPSVRATLGECYGLSPGTPVTGKMVTALKMVGFDKVFDTNLCADMTIVEEATEFIKRFKSGEKLPLITTCCPAWIKFGEQFFYEELSHMSTCMSPQAMMGRLIKTYFAQLMSMDPKDIVLIDIMPCTAKKFEIQRPEFNGDVDHVLTTVELGRLLRKFNVDLKALPDTQFDSPLGESTGAATIFGRSGGVMEAAIRTAADFLTGKDLEEIEYHKVRGMKTLKEAELEIDGKKIKIAVVQTLGEARKIMETIRDGTCTYHFIEIMACYGGCIGGGGQPQLSSEEILLKRAKALNEDDKNTAIRKSHLNQTVIKIYKDYIGEFGSEKAHKLLHTHYSKREYIG